MLISRLLYTGNLGAPKKQLLDKKGYLEQRSSDIAALSFPTIIHSIKENLEFIETPSPLAGTVSLLQINSLPKMVCF